MRNDKFAFRKRFLRLNNEQRIRIGCLGKTEIRNKCDSKSDAGKVDQVDSSWLDDIVAAIV